MINPRLEQMVLKLSTCDVRMKQRESSWTTQLFLTGLTPNCAVYMPQMQIAIPITTSSSAQVVLVIAQDLKFMEKDRAPNVR